MINQCSECTRCSAKIATSFDVGQMLRQPIYHRKLAGRKYSDTLLRTAPHWNSRTVKQWTQPNEWWNNRSLHDYVIIKCNIQNIAPDFSAVYIVHLDTYLPPYRSLIILLIFLSNIWEAILVLSDYSDFCNPTKPAVPEYFPLCRYVQVCNVYCIRTVRIFAPHLYFH